MSSAALGVSSIPVGTTYTSRWQSWMSVKIYNLNSSSILIGLKYHFYNKSDISYDNTFNIALNKGIIFQFLYIMFSTQCLNL